MDSRVIIYDTETTGIRSDKDRIVEIAALDVSTGETFVELVNPGCSIPIEASRVHHITDDQVKECKDFKEVGQKFIDFCREDAILVAHNNDSFDLLFIQQECKRHSLTMPKWRFFDTLKWARRYRPDLPRHTLQFLREVYDIPANQAHRALDDVIVLHRIFKLMTDDLHIEQIMDLISGTKEIKLMPFGKYQGKPLKEVPPDYVGWLFKNGALEKESNRLLKESFEQLGILKNYAV